MRGGEKTEITSKTSKTSKTSETDVAKECDSLARGLGWDVESYSDTRAVRTHPGLPDRRYVQRRRGLRVWAELKAPAGKLTEEQHAFLLAELATGAHALAVDSVDVLRHLLSLLSRDMGRAAALDYCRDVTRLIAQRGYRNSSCKT